MTPAELRRACELANLQVDGPDNDWTVIVGDGFGDLNPRFVVERAWIESRCASVLVGMVTACGMNTLATYVEHLSGQPMQMRGYYGVDGATDEQRIHAAFFAITGEELA